MSDMSISSFVDKVMSRYDRNKDGVIDMKGNDASLKASENSEMVHNVKIWEGGIDYKVIKTDMSSLFKAAAKDNHTTVSRQDLVDYLSSNYDQNKDGLINSKVNSCIPFIDFFVDSELKDLEKDHPEHKTSTFIKDEDGGHSPNEKLPKGMLG